MKCLHNPHLRKGVSHLQVRHKIRDMKSSVQRHRAARAGLEPTRVSLGSSTLYWTLRIGRLCTGRNFKETSPIFHYTYRETESQRGQTAAQGHMASASWNPGSRKYSAHMPSPPKLLPCIYGSFQQSQHWHVPLNCSRPWNVWYPAMTALEQLELGPQRPPSESGVHFGLSGRSSQQHGRVTEAHQEPKSGSLGLGSHCYHMVLFLLP